MKKLTAAFILLFTFSLIANQAKAQVDFGIRGGVNFATFNDVDDNPGSRTGIMAGVYLNYHISNSPISIQPELLYTQKGAVSPNGDITIELDYIAIPVLAKFDYILDGSVTPHVYFGPYIGFLINSDYESANNSVDFEEFTKTTDFGVIVGAGIDVNRFNVGVRYSVGLTPVFEDDGQNTQVDSKNGVISIVAGVGF